MAVHAVSFSTTKTFLYYTEYLMEKEDLNSVLGSASLGPS